jgi:hypothetical protein
MVARTCLSVKLYVHYVCCYVLHYILRLSLSLSLSLSLLISVFAVLLLHKPIPCYGKNRSTPTAPQNHRFNPNQAFDVYSCLLTSPVVVTINSTIQRGLLACQKYPLPQYYYSVSRHELMRQNFLLPPTPYSPLTYLFHVTQTFIRS